MQRKSTTHASLEVKDTPEKDRYIRIPHPIIQEQVINRLKWVEVLILMLASPIPLLGKALLNLLNGSFKESGKNILTAIALLLLGSGVSIVGILLPNLANTLVQAGAFPAKQIFQANSQSQDKRSIREEVGPKPTPNEHIAYHTMNGTLLELKLPPTRTFPEVKGIDGIVIDTADVKSSEATARYRICFNANASYYQKHFPRTAEQTEILQVNSRLFNYPGITKSDSVKSVYDIINSGIAEVYDLAKTNQWSNHDIEKNLHIYGYCSGGLFALQVAVYFKQKHNIDLTIILDRSPASLQAVAAEQLEYLGMPSAYAKLLYQSLLQAGGNFDIDAVSAIRLLNPAKVHYINIGYITPPPPETLQESYGIGPHRLTSADPGVPDRATVASTLEREHITTGTAKIFAELKIDTTTPRFFTTQDPHHISMGALYMNPLLQGTTALDYYTQMLHDTDSPNPISYKG